MSNVDYTFLVNKFKTFVLATLCDEALAWKNGNKEWTVANQFDESTINSALKIAVDLPEEKWATLTKRFNIDINGFNEKFLTPINIATVINDLFKGFEAPEISKGWTE